MLDIFGLDALSEEIYRLMLTHPDKGVEGLADLVGTTEAQVRRALECLSELSLVSTSEQDLSGFRALNPETAMELLLAQQQSELTVAQMRLDATKAAAVKLVAAYSSLCPPYDDRDFERLVGPEEIGRHLAGFAALAETEVMTFAHGGAHPEEELVASRTPNVMLLERGIRMRTLYLDSLRNHQPTLHHMRWLSDRGAEVRTAASLPVRMVIVDRCQAVLPMRSADARVGAVVIRSEATVAALCALFEAKWEKATPFGSGPTVDDRGLSVQEAEVIRLLAEGLTDQAIAKRLGVSDRTARRIAAELMERLNARSRFEAGVRAVQRGWIPLEQVPDQAAPVGSDRDQ
ncbi:helix-turn-helix transcriptional regulator [Streptantibioticus ferralitis]|uniref:Helix-turn-helix transcriptional regulator n=2 Tax=Streptantibioticus ferralitis TaxID=236510 RepID=A0ABT5Z1T1_9ACTN|nr:helix-turn-helix transcriptional regulator [Streptantibioticus ferralitis]